MIAKSVRKLGRDETVRYAIILGAVAASLASINFPFGFAEDGDGYRVI